MNELKKTRKLRIFTSFEEQEEEMIFYWASISPLERLEHLYKMIQISFRLHNTKIEPKKRSLHIINYEQ